MKRAGGFFAGPGRGRRRGASLLEVQIAFAVLGIGLAGLCPFVVTQLRQVTRLESRLAANRYVSTYVYEPSGPVVRPGSGTVYYLVPWNNPWTQKLTTRAQLLTSPANSGDPAVSTRPASGFPHVTLPQAVSLSLDGNGTVTSLTAVVQVQ